MGMDKLTNKELIAAAMYCADKNTLSCLGCPAYNHCDENDMFSLERELAKRLQEASASRVLVRCKDCKHLTVYNSPTLYAYCQKTHLRFEPFQEDTRTHYCSYGERRTDADC